MRRQNGNGGSGGSEGVAKTAVRWCQFGNHVGSVREATVLTVYRRWPTVEGGRRGYLIKTEQVWPQPDVDRSSHFSRCEWPDFQQNNRLMKTCPLYVRLELLTS